MDITELVLQPRTVHDCRFVLGLVVFFQVVVLGLHQKQTHTHARTHAHTHTHTHTILVYNPRTSIFPGPIMHPWYN